MLKFFVYACASMGQFYYFMLLGICSYWLLFYKGQSVLFIFLPNTKYDFDMFTAIFVTVFVTQVLFF